MRFSAASNFFFSAFVLSFYIARFTDLLSLFCVALHVALNVTWILFAQYADSRMSGMSIAFNSNLIIS